MANQPLCPQRSL